MRLRVLDAWARKARVHQPREDVLDGLFGGAERVDNLSRSPVVSIVGRGRIRDIHQEVLGAVEIALSKVDLERTTEAWVVS